MATLHNKNLEVRALFSVTRPGLVSTYLLTVLSSSHFAFPPAEKAFERFSSILQKKSELTDWDTLCADPTVDDEYRQMLLNFDVEEIVLETKEEAQGVWANLEQYRLARAINDAASEALDALDQPSFDAESILEELAQGVASARTSGAEQQVWHMGKGTNMKPVMKNLLDASIRVPVIKTGFNAFDNETGGLPESGLVIVAAPTGCGKSAMAQQLAINMYNQCRSVAIVTLEMAETQYLGRVMANLAGVDNLKIKNKTFDSKEKKALLRAYNAHVKYGKDNECRFSIFPPREDMTLTQLLMLLKPFKYDVIVIDYIGLLKGIDGDRQWQLMSEVAREAKIFSDHNNCLVLMLAQLNEDVDKLKHSTGIKDHADNVWIWRLKDGDREVNKLTVQQVKGRDNPIMDFDLDFNFAHMKFWSSQSPKDSTNVKVTTTEDDEEEGSTGFISGLDDSDIDSEWSS